MKLLYYPNSLLNVQSAEVTEPIEQSVIDEMFSIMNRYNGIGLSAIQVGIPKMFFIMFDGTVVVNPTVSHKGERVKMLEGCLSLPGIQEQVSRFTTIQIGYTNKDLTKTMESEVTGQFAHVFQHEFDHLYGRLFANNLSKAKRSTIIGHIQKLKREGKI